LERFTHTAYQIVPYESAVCLAERINAIAPVEGQGYRVTTPERSILAENVVVATGFEQRPKIPATASSKNMSRTAAAVRIAR